MAGVDKRSTLYGYGGAKDNDSCKVIGADDSRGDNVLICSSNNTHSLNNSNNNNISCISAKNNITSHLSSKGSNMNRFNNSACFRSMNAPFPKSHGAVQSEKDRISGPNANLISTPGEKIRITQQIPKHIDTPANFVKTGKLGLEEDKNTTANDRISYSTITITSTQFKKNLFTNNDTSDEQNNMKINSESLNRNGHNNNSIGEVNYEAVRKNQKDCCGNNDTINSRNCYESLQIHKEKTSDNLDSSGDLRDDVESLDQSTSIEPASSNNTSQNSDSSSAGSSASEGNPKKTDSTLAFSDPRQRQVFNALTGIQSLRKSGQFSDVTIRVKGQEFRCHRFILSKASTFFHDLVNEKNNDSEVNKTEKDAKSPAQETEVTVSKSSGGTSVIVLTGVEPQIFEKVLDFVYCVFDDRLIENTALELLLAADTFHLTNLSQTCVTHIADTVSVENVYDVIGLVDSGCTSLSDHVVRMRCHQVMRENFLHLSCKKEFLGLNRTRMISLVADSMLCIKIEMDLIQPLIRWVNVRPSERCADLTLMLQLIRFPLMSPEELDKLLEINFLKENTLAKALIDESRAYGHSDLTEKMSWPRQNCISRCQFPSRDFIIWTADRDKGLHLYSIIDGLHHKVLNFNLSTTANPGFNFDSTSTVCCYSDRLFFTGGEFNTDLAWSVDSATGDVSVHSKMPRGRKFHSMVVSRGCVYCLGGQDKRGYTVLDSVDAYVISKDLWLKVGHMAVATYNMTAVTSAGAIYLIGGIDQSGQSLRLVQCFAVLRSGLYSAFKVEISNMPPSLLSARAVTSGLDGSIYIVCGHGEVYRLDIEKQYLHHLKTLESLNQNPRVRFGLAHVGGCLVVTGGHQLGQVIQEPIRSVCMDIASKVEVKDYSPLLPADIVNTCFYAKLNSGILGLSKLSSPSI